jgi:peptidylprolyl isomerase
MMRRRLSTSVLAVLAAGLAACGSSSKAPGVQLAPSAGATEASAPASTPTTPTTTVPTAAAPTATTPKPPSPLSKQPVVGVPSGPAPTHLVVKDLIPGSGRAAKAGSTVTVNYVGVLYKGGKEFDSSWRRGQPLAPFQLGQGSVIPGWDQGLVGMKVGGRRELVIPPSLGYGATGSPPAIPPNATLVFVIDLLGVT